MSEPPAAKSIPISIALGELQRLGYSSCAYRRHGSVPKLPLANMEVYDIIMLVLLVAATIFGAWKGLAWQVASLGAIVASCLVTVRFQEPVSGMIQAKEPWNVFLAMLILYVGTSFIIWVGFRFVSGFIDRLKLKEFDRQLGAILGCLKGVLLCVVVTLFAVTLLGDSPRRSIVQSYSGYYIALLLDRSHSVLPQEIHDRLHPYIHSLDARLTKDERTNDHEAAPATNEPSLIPVEDLLQAFERLPPKETPARR
jgi:membrane protein required for colicin V production